MKKLYILLILTMLLIITGCSNSEQNTKKEASTSTTAVNSDNTDKKVKSDTTFKDGVLTTNEYELKIKKAEVIQSASIGDPGLFVTFELKNKTNKDLNPSIVFDSLVLTQKSENTRVQLDSDYSYLDAFGGDNDVDKYNEMVDLSNKQDDAVLAGKTAEKIEAYFLDNKTNPVIFETIYTNGKYEVKLK